MTSAPKSATPETVGENPKNSQNSPVLKSPNSVGKLKGETIADFLKMLQNVPKSPVATADKIDSKSVPLVKGATTAKFLKVPPGQQNEPQECEAADLKNEAHKNEEFDDKIFEVKLEPEELFSRIFNQNQDKNTKVSYVPKDGLQVSYDLFGNPIFANAPNRGAPPLQTVTTKQLQEVDKNDDLYKLIYKDIKVPSTMSWDQIPAYVQEKVEENYQTLKPTFFPNLAPFDSVSSHRSEDEQIR